VMSLEEYLNPKAPFPLSYGKEHERILIQWEEQAESHHDNNVSPALLLKSEQGLLIRDDRYVVFRCDWRSPQEIAAQGGFGPSQNFVGIPPMIQWGQRNPLITAGSARGVWHFQEGELSSSSYSEGYYIYAINTVDCQTVSLKENLRHNAEALAKFLHEEVEEMQDDPGGEGALSFDEVHVDSQVPLKNIFLVATDTGWARCISEYSHSGFPLKALLKKTFH
jgi:hypothetical protein